jgi:hypothetical protein
MTDSIDEDTVEFKPNYDSRETEPVVLPAAFPNLLVNGSAGIAVGMATNIAPHNLVEVVQALRHLVKHPDAGLDDLMRFVPGPDLPTGGKIIGLDGIREAYESGRGSFRMRATARVEGVSSRRRGIVVTELPYNVGPERVIERIKGLVQAKKLQGIADIKNLTDREHGLQLVIEVKNGFHPEAILEQLYAQTPMEDSFGINAVALVDGQPRTLGLKQLLEVYLGHRYDVVRRRTTFRRTKATDRLHLVEGLLVAIVDIDEVIELIRSSENADEAKARLIQVFDLSEVQAGYILDMPLRRLTRYSRLELDRERAELELTIAGLDAVLEDESRLREVVSDELAEVAKSHGTPRRTVCWSPPGSRRGRRYRSRWPTSHAWSCCRRPGCSPARRPARSAARWPHAPGTTGHQRRRGDGARTDRGRHQRGSDDPPGSPGPARAAGDGRRPASSGRSAGERVPVAGARRAGRVPVDAGERLRRPGARHRRGGGQAGHGGPPDQQGRLGGHPDGGRRQRRRRGGAADRQRGARCSSPPTRSCCTSAHRRFARRGVPEAGSRAYAWPETPVRCSSARSRRAPTRSSSRWPARGRRSREPRPARSR